MTDADPKVDLYAAFGYDQKDFMECNAQRPGAECDAQGCTCWSTKGVAYVGGACKDFSKTSMNEYSPTTAETAMASVYTISQLNLTFLINWIIWCYVTLGFYLNIDFSS